MKNWIMNEDGIRLELELPLFLLSIERLGDAEFEFSIHGFGNYELYTETIRGTLFKTKEEALKRALGLCEEQSSTIRRHLL